MAHPTARELRALAMAIKKAGDQPLAARMRRGLIAATDGVDAEVKAAFADAMPSGYRDDLTRSMRVRTSVRTGSYDARVSVVVFADGTRERRDVPSLNRGRLRHPVWGRARTLKSGARQQNPWATTRVPPRAFDKTVDAAHARVVDRMRAVLADISDQIMKG